MPQKGGMLKAILPAALLAALFKGSRKGRSIRSKSGKRLVGGKRRRTSRKSRKSRRRRMRGGVSELTVGEDAPAQTGGRRHRRKSRSKRRKNRKSRKSRGKRSKSRSRR